jgi:uncharacterized protein (DUF305 family)
MSRYLCFGAMIGISATEIFGLLYLNTYALDYRYWSQTRGWMALPVGATMAIEMQSFMAGMYRNRAANIAIHAVAIAVFAGALRLVRSQSTVEDVARMKAMIPHRSSGMLARVRAGISNPRAADLAGRIIEAQRSEIAEMKTLMADLEVQ